jgi:hypothetical protein
MTTKQTQEAAEASEASTLWMGHGPRAMVQVVCLTVDGKKIVCLGPVLHLPSAGVLVGEVQEVEFGELIPADMAANLLNGDLSRWMGVQ